MTTAQIEVALAILQSAADEMDTAYIALKKMQEKIHDTVALQALVGLAVTTVHALFHLTRQAI